jgi:hypothetical protein
MSLQIHPVAPGQTEATRSVRSANDDLGFGGIDRKSEVTYPVPIAIRVLWWMWVIGTAGIIVMLVLGGMR